MTVGIKEKEEKCKGKELKKKEIYNNCKRNGMKKSMLKSEQQQCSFSVYWVSRWVLLKSVSHCDFSKATNYIFCKIILAHSNFGKLDIIQSTQQKVSALTNLIMR